MTVEAELQGPRWCEPGLTLATRDCAATTLTWYVADSTRPFGTAISLKTSTPGRLRASSPRQS